jgi:hypothetical protein
MADEPWLQDKNKRVVCLKRENSTDMQQWKIEPVKKKIKIESAAGDNVSATQPASQL